MPEPTIIDSKLPCRCGTSFLSYPPPSGYERGQPVGIVKVTCAGCGRWYANYDYGALGLPGVEGGGRDTRKKNRKVFE